MARKYQALLGWVSTSNFVSYVLNNLITNGDITVDGINRVEHIYGTLTPLSKGKMKRERKKSKIMKTSFPLPIEN